MRVQDVNSAGRTDQNQPFLETRGMQTCFSSLSNSKLRNLGRDIMEQLW